MNPAEVRGRSNSFEGRGACPQVLIVGQKALSYQPHAKRNVPPPPKTGRQRYRLNSARGILDKSATGISGKYRGPLTQGRLSSSLLIMPAFVAGSALWARRRSTSRVEAGNVCVCVHVSTRIVLKSAVIIVAIVNMAPVSELQCTDSTYMHPERQGKKRFRKMSSDPRIESGRGC